MLTFGVDAALLADSSVVLICKSVEQAMPQPPLAASALLLKGRYSALLQRLDLQLPTADLQDFGLQT